MENFLKDWRVLTFLAAGVLLLGAGLYYGFPVGNTDPALPGARFDRFAEVQWGASPEKVEEKYSPGTITRTPLSSGRTKEGTRLVVKNHRMNGDTVDVGFIFHPDIGLVKGYYYAQFGRGDDCLRVYRKFYQSINRKIGQHRTKQNQYNRLQVRFCYAVLVGKALKYAQWKTPDGLTVTLMLGGEKSRRRVRVFYETAEFYRWKQDPWVRRVVDNLMVSLRNLFG